MSSGEDLLARLFPKFIILALAPPAPLICRFIIRMTKITRVPKVSNYIKGVINVRGVVIPTISLRLKLGLPEEVISKKTRISILTLEQQESIGVLVDEVKEVVTLDEEHIERMGYEKDDKERFLSGVGKSDGKLISLLDITSVLAEVVDA